MLLNRVLCIAFNIVKYQNMYRRLPVQIPLISIELKNQQVAETWTERRRSFTFHVNFPAWKIDATLAYTAPSVDRLCKASETDLAFTSKLGW